MQQLQQEAASSETSLSDAHRGLAVKISGMLKRLVEESASTCRCPEVKTAELVRRYRMTKAQREHLWRRVKGLFDKMAAKSYGDGVEDAQKKRAVAEKALEEAHYAYKQTHARCERLRKAIDAVKTEATCPGGEEDAFVYVSRGAKPLRAELRENRCLLEQVKRTLARLQRKICAMKMDADEEAAAAATGWTRLALSKMAGGSSTSTSTSSSASSSSVFGDGFWEGALSGVGAASRRPCKDASASTATS